LLQSIAHKNFIAILVSLANDTLKLTENVTIATTA